MLGIGTPLSEFQYTPQARSKQRSWPFLLAMFESSRACRRQRAPPDLQSLLQRDVDLGPQPEQVQLDEHLTRDIERTDHADFAAERRDRASRSILSDRPEDELIGHRSSLCSRVLIFLDRC